MSVPDLGAGWNGATGKWFGETAAGLRIRGARGVVAPGRRELYRACGCLYVAVVHGEVVAIGVLLVPYIQLTGDTGRADATGEGGPCLGTDACTTLMGLATRTLAAGRTMDCVGCLELATKLASAGARRWTVVTAGMEFSRDAGTMRDVATGDSERCLAPALAA